MASAYKKVNFAVTVLANTIARHTCAGTCVFYNIACKVMKYDRCRTASWRRKDGVITRNNHRTDRKRLEEEANEERMNGCFSKQAVG